MKTSELKEKYLFREKLWASIREKTENIFVAFSMGKDALCALAELKRFGEFKIHLYHWYLVPGLEFVEEELKRFEDFFGIEIHRLPHPSFHRWLSNLVFQSPENFRAIAENPPSVFEYEDIVGCLRKKLGAFDWWIADGVRAADSPIRRWAIVKHGPITESKMKFHAVWDYTISDVKDVLKRERIKLPIDYELFGRTFDGLDYRFIGPIKEKFPKDFQVIKSWFPMVEAEIFRYEKMGMASKRRNFFKEQKND